jgi:Flp pilus assembly pilin Flp
MMQRLWSQEGQDVAEYAVILAVVILLVVVTVRLIGIEFN